MGEQPDDRRVQRLGVGQISRALLCAALAFLSLSSQIGLAKTPAYYGTLSQEQLLELESDPSVDSSQQPELLLWLTYRLRYEHERSLPWLQKSVTALANTSSPHPDLVVVSELLNCYLSSNNGLVPRSGCLELRDKVANIAKRDLRAISWHLLGGLFERSGQILEALELNQLALVEAEQYSLVDDMAELHNSRGVAYLQLGLPLQAFEHFVLAHQYLNSSGTQNLVTRRVLAFNLGVSQLGAGLYAEAKETFLSAIPWVSETGNLSWMTTAVTYLAHAEIKLGNPVAAINSLQAHLETQATNINHNTLLAAQAALAEARLATGQVDQALTELNIFLQQAKANNNSSKLVQLQLILARAYNLAGDPEAALATLARLEPKLNIEIPTENNHQALTISASSHAALGDYAAAFTAQSKAQEVEQATQSDNFKTQLSLLQAKLDRDKNAHELMLSMQRERELYMQTKLSRTILIGSLVLGSLLVLIAYLLLSRRFQRRLAERERYASSHLEAQVAERTQALESTMAARLNVEEDRRLLQQSLFEGEKLRALGQLTGGVAHDFNNLMTVVTLSAELLKDDLTEQQNRAQQSVSDILRAAQSAADITSGLLAYARKQPLKPERLELQEFINELLPLFQRSLDENISLSLRAPERCRVEVDRSQLTTCLLNLLLNAKEALTDGGAIVISLEASPAELGEFVQISVTDNGCGIPASQLKLATDPFFTTKETNQGSGLGLSMVFGFVKQSGGDLKITSTENLGTEVTITLPLVNVSNEPAADILVREPVALPKKVKVLVVEDQSEVRDVLQRLLESLGLEVSIAISGDAGKQMLEELAEDDEPDLLITDIVMPGDTSGYALAAFAQQRCPGLAILIISGYSESHDSDWPFLHKPFSLNELRDKVTTLLAPQPQGTNLPIVHALPTRSSAQA